MSDSILTTTKAALGLAETDTSFDIELTMYINSTLATINQLGIGPDDGLTITDASATWEDLIGNEKRYEGVKAYMFMCVRLLFDPPSIGYVLTSWEKLKDAAEWRLNRAREDIEHPAPPSTDRRGTVITDGSDLDSAATRFFVRAGLPFSRRLRITNGKDIWANLVDFEARMQIRAAKASSSELKFDFSQYLVKSFDDNDIIIEWTLSGAQTRTLQSGYYDLVVSDTGSTDARAIEVIHGYLELAQLVTT